MRKHPVEKVSIKIENNKSSSLERKPNRKVYIEPGPVPAKHANDVMPEQLFSLFKQFGLIKDNKSLECNFDLNEYKAIGNI